MSSGGVVGRISTVNLERQLLYYLMSSKLNLQFSMGKHRRAFFTNKSRLFIYELIDSYFTEKRSTLSEKQFEFELQKRFDSVRNKIQIDDFTSEFNLIKSTKATETLDLIIAKLEEVQLANSIDELIRESYSALESGNISEAANLLRQKSINLKETKKENRILNLHKESDDWFAEVRNRKNFPDQYAGLPTGFERFDKMTGGLFPAELTIVFGLSGKGKSTFLKAMGSNIRKSGRVVLHCGNEENEFQMRSKYMSSDSGIKYSPFKHGTFTEDEFKNLKLYSDNARDVGAIYVYEFPQQTDVIWIERAFRALEMQGIKVDVIIVDYLDLMKPVQDAYSENDEQGKITSDLKQLSIDCNCPVITATQAGTSSERQERKARPFLTSADVFGTKRKVHSANTLIGIVNQTATIGVGEDPDADRTKHKMVLCVPKNRDGAIFTFRQVMDVECGKFYEDTDEDDPVMRNLEKQAIEMIDETREPGTIRAEIDVKEMANARKNDLTAKLERLHRELATGDINDDNSSIESKPSKVTTSKQSAPQTHLNHICDNDYDDDDSDDDDDTFFSDAPDAEDY